MTRARRSSRDLRAARALIEQLHSFTRGLVYRTEPAPAGFAPAQGAVADTRGASNATARHCYRALLHPGEHALLPVAVLQKPQRSPVGYESANCRA